MIRCNKCGTLNEADASFCTACNSYLEWSGEKVQDDAHATSESSEDDPTLTDAKEPASGSTDQPSAQEPHSTVAQVDTAPPRDETAEADAAQPDTSGTVPPPARTPVAAAPEQPSSRRPAKATAAPAPRPRQAAAVKVNQPAPGDLVCATCGTGNDPARKFCRHCGQSLASAPAAVAPASLPWYRRLFRRKTPQTYAAGTRPADLGSKRSWRPGCILLILGLLVVLVIGGIVAYLSVPAATDLVEDAVSSVTELVEERTLAYPTATGQGVTGHPVADVVDKSLRTYWLGRQNDRGRWVLELRFEREVDLRSVNVHSGAEGDEYLEFGRPRRVRIRAGDDDAGIVTLEDTKKIQPIAINLSGIRELRLTVLDTYRGELRANDMAIRELEFEVVK